MTRILFVLAVLFGLGYWANSIFQDKAKDTQRRQATAERQRTLASTVKAMATEANASTDWAQSLSQGKRMRMSPILSAELQDVWTPDRAILFIGRVEDIARNQDGSFQIRIAYDSMGHDDMFLDNRILVSLRCPAPVAAPLVKALKTRSRANLDADIAAIANIESIVSSSERDAAGNATTVLTGNGTCSKAMYMPELLFD